MSSTLAVARPRHPPEPQSVSPCPELCQLTDLCWRTPLHQPAPVGPLRQCCWSPLSFNRKDTHSHVQFGQLYSSYCLQLFILLRITPAVGVLYYFFCICNSSFTVVIENVCFPCCACTPAVILLFGNVYLHCGTGRWRVSFVCLVHAKIEQTCNINYWYAYMCRESCSGSSSQSKEFRHQLFGDNH